MAQNNRAMLWRKKSQLTDLIEKMQKNRCLSHEHRALQIDHVHGHGTKELKKLSLNCGYLKKVLADTEGNYQLLCANCNWIKRSENKEVRS